MSKFAALLLLAAAPLMAQMTAKWEHDFATAQKRAKAEQKVIFMDLWAEWCGPCRRLQSHTFPDAKAVAALNKVVPFSALVQKADGTPLPEGSELAKKYNLNAYPTLILIDADGKELRRKVGFLEPAQLVAFLEGK